jgi:ketosteroid isomerase-like protein
MNIVKSLLAICLLFILQIASVAQDVEPIEIPSELRTVLDNYEKYWQAKDEAGLASLFTEDGFVMSPGKRPVRGRDNIEEAYRNSGGGLVLKAFDYGIDGDLAYILGGYSGHPSWPIIGKFTLVLKKIDGSWLIQSDMDNPITREGN